MITSRNSIIEHDIYLQIIRGSLICGEKYADEHQAVTNDEVFAGCDLTPFTSAIVENPLKVNNDLFEKNENNMELSSAIDIADHKIVISSHFAQNKCAQVCTSVHNKFAQVKSFQFQIQIAFRPSIR